MPDNWRSVEIKHLRALGAIADTGTFWAASEELNSSLSTVSDHITALEALVGERLIERSRGRRTVELTEAGRVLLGHAEAIESRLRAAEADFRAYAAGVSGSLRIGIYQSVANKVLPEVMRRFKERWPDVDVQVTEAAHDNELVDAVERGGLRHQTSMGCRWLATSAGSSRTAPRSFCSVEACGRASSFSPTTTERCRRWWRRDLDSRWRLCLQWMKPTLASA